ncbi:hypothetical protein B484DRAFT_355947 [Ochromonadaceae sp. CCMP2298]|nr:hypothetical protein B484DRAFT_355947 [Ochromonadaceae sp. CCMP2298]
MLLFLLLACLSLLSLLLVVDALLVQRPLQHAHKRLSKSALQLFGRKSVPKVQDDKNTKASQPKSGLCNCCSGKGFVDCKVCSGTGKDKVNGNVFERWTCTSCKGFALVVCPKCSTGGGGKFKAGLTPEQTGER